MGAIKFKAQLKVFGVEVSEEECKRIIHVYRETYPHIPVLWKAAQKALDAIASNQTTSIGAHPEVLIVENGGIRLPSGLFLRYPGLVKDSDGQYSYKTRMGQTKIYGGKVTENFTQAVARCAVGEQMLRVARKYKVALTVHDSIVCIAKEAEAEEAVAYVTECMKWRPKWAQTLPLTCEVGVAKNYGEA